MFCFIFTFFSFIYVYYVLMRNVEQELYVLRIVILNFEENVFLQFQIIFVEQQTSKIIQVL